MPGIQRQEIKPRQNSNHQEPKISVFYVQNNYNIIINTAEPKKEKDEAKKEKDIIDIAFDIFMRFYVP